MRILPSQCREGKYCGRTTCACSPPLISDTAVGTRVHAVHTHARKGFGITVTTTMCRSRRMFRMRSRLSIGTMELTPRRGTRARTKASASCGMIGRFAGPRCDSVHFLSWYALTSSRQCSMAGVVPCILRTRGAWLYTNKLLFERVVTFISNQNQSRRRACCSRCRQLTGLGPDTP